METGFTFIKPKPSGHHLASVKSGSALPHYFIYSTWDIDNHFRPRFKKYEEVKKMKFIFYLSLFLIFNSATMSADWSVGSFAMVRYTFNIDGSCEIKDFHEFYLYEGDEHTCEADLCFAEGNGTALVLMHPSMRAGGDGSWYACIKTPAGMSKEVELWQVYDRLSEDVKDVIDMLGGNRRLLVVTKVLPDGGVKVFYHPRYSGRPEFYDRMLKKLEKKLVHKRHHTGSTVEL
jgi:hypothetical protein